MYIVQNDKKWQPIPRGKSFVIGKFNQTHESMLL